MSDNEPKENEEEVKPAAGDVPAEETAVDENGPVNVGHQDNDLDLKTVKKFIIASFAVTIVFFILMLVVLKFFKNGYEKERGVSTAETRQIPAKNDALLQTRPLTELQEYNDLEESRLNMNTNATEHAVIPVESAKQLMLSEKAFPTPEAGTPKEEEMVDVQKSAPESASTVAEAEPAQPSGTETAETGETEPAPDPAMVSAGKTLFKANCVVCHSGTKTAIGPNIEKAYGTMRKLENHDPILMDKAYILNSLNNPAEHIAKGYPPVMTSFKEQFPDEQKEQIAAYLQSQGKPIVKAKPKPAPTAAPAPVAEQAAAPTARPAVEPAPAPTATPTPVPAAPQAPAEPEAPAPEKPEAPSGVIFV